VRQLGGFLALAILATACAALLTSPSAQEPEGYAFHRMVDKDLAIHWNLTRQDAEVVAEGYIQHIGGVYALRYVTVTLEGREAGGKVVNEAQTTPSPNWLKDPGAQGLFRVTMPLKGLEAAFDMRADFLIDPTRPGDRGRDFRR